MSTPKHKPTLTVPELVETQNIYRSIERLRSHGYDAPAKRAILHACAMGLLRDDQLKAMREAMNLP